MDASNIRRQLRESKEAALQIAYADTLVLNKTDLVSDADLDEVERILTGINGEARVVRSERSAVDLGVVLNQGAVSVAGRRGRRPVLGQLAEATPASVTQTGRGFWARGVEKYAPSPSPVHDGSIRTVCLAVEGRLNERKFESWLEGVLWEQQQDGAADDAGGGGSGGGGGDSGDGGGSSRVGDSQPLEVLRAKGLLFTSEEGEDGEVRDVKKILQAVREVYEITPGPPVESPAERMLNKVVLIGRGLGEEKLLRGLQETLA